VSVMRSAGGLGEAETGSTQPSARGVEQKVTALSAAVAMVQGQQRLQAASCPSCSQSLSISTTTCTSEQGSGRGKAEAGKRCRA
jgi:hypothetical protein